MKKIGFVIAIGLMVVIFSCTKEEVSPVSTDSETAAFTYSSLNMGADTIDIGASTSVTAVASGSNLTYTWSVQPVGTLLGSGSSITFNACCGGEHHVTCDVSDGTTTLSKTVMIFGADK